MLFSGALSSFVTTHMLMRASADGLAKQRAKLWGRLQPTLLATPALKAFVGHELSELPIVNPADIRSDYGAWNSLGLCHDQLLSAAQDSEDGGTGTVLPGVTCGFSTGSSGTRGLFVASAEERADYLGQSLARLLPLGTLMRPARIGLVLRANSDLYRDVGKASRFAFRHFPLTLSDTELMEQMQAWQPTILIAPAHKLRTLALAIEAGKLRLDQLQVCFSGSEPMSVAERGWIAGAMGVQPGFIYQATEGFLGGSCRFGRLHLNDHSVSIVEEPVAGTDGWRPIVTDLRRKSQPIVNVRLDDFLEDDDRGPCPCGYKGRVIGSVMGRVSDLWWLQGAVYSPRQITEAMDTLVGPNVDWQAVGCPDHASIALPPDWSVQAKADVCAGLKTRLALPIPVIASPNPPQAPAPKRRRIIWREMRDV
jgi:putative adenylate-forming enzyme